MHLIDLIGKEGIFYYLNNLLSSQQAIKLIF